MFLTKSSLNTNLGSNCLILMYLVTYQSPYKIKWPQFPSKSIFQSYLCTNRLILMYLVTSYTNKELKWRQFLSYLGPNCRSLMYFISYTHWRLNWPYFISKSSFMTYLRSNQLILTYLVTLLTHSKLNWPQFSLILVSLLLGPNCLSLMYFISYTHWRLNWPYLISKSSFMTYLGSNQLILTYLVTLLTQLKWSQFLIKSTCKAY